MSWVVNLLICTTLFNANQCEQYSVIFFTILWVVYHVLTNVMIKYAHASTTQIIITKKKRRETCFAPTTINHIIKTHTAVHRFGWIITIRQKYSSCLSIRHYAMYIALQKINDALHTKYYTLQNNNTIPIGFIIRDVYVPVINTSKF